MKKRLHFLKSSHLPFIYVGLALTFVFTLVFQNCSSTGIRNKNLNQTIPFTYLLNGKNLPEVNHIGTITVQSSTDSDPQDQFSLNQEVVLKLIDSHSNSHSYDWVIIRGFNTIVNQTATTHSSYTYTFTQKGAYDIIVLSYAEGSTSDIISWANKRVIIGDECDPSHIMEFHLNSGHLTQGDNQSVSFEIESNKSNSSITWHISSGESSFQQTTDIMTISLTSTTESVFIEASELDPNADGCLTYRVRNETVNANNTPYINSVRPVNQSNPVTLENNDIYKYTRASQTNLEVDVVDADQCQWNDTIVDCGGGIISNINGDDQDTTLCVDSQETLQISYTQSEESVSDEKQYYKYCPSNKDFCYFGPVHNRPNNHYCEQGRLVAASKASPKPSPINGVCDNTAQNSCTTGIPNDAAIDDTSTHYKWYCEGENGGSTATNCQMAIPIDGVCNNTVRNGCTAGTSNDAVIDDTNTHYRWYCVGANGGNIATNCQKAKPAAVNGTCNNAQRNGCSSGTANDNAIADTNTHYRWHCVGANGGSTATNCQKAKATHVNGVCNNGQRNGCTTGTANDSVAPDTSTHYRWHCVGQNGGTTATNCQIAKATRVNGVCNNGQRNGCTTGTANDSVAPDTSTHYRWHCVGQNGGTTATNCQIAKATRVNGVCNNGQRNGCTSGTANDSVAPDTSTHYRWHCVGRNGGTTATNCQTAKATRVNGICNNGQRNGCTTGTANDSVAPDTSTHYRWHCVGQNGGTTATNCQTAKRNTASTTVNGVCNNTQRNGCATGTANDNAVPDTSAHYKWSCVGSNGGTTASNCQIAKPVNGVCNNAQRNGCSSGTANDNAIADTNTHYRWHCEGLHGGTTAQNCQKAKPAQVNGACNNSQRNGCTTGTANDSAVPDTSAHYKWSCVGSNGGTTASNCQIAKPVNGVCNNAQKNGCTTGTANDSAVPDTSAHYKWSCVGSNGGTTASNCQIAKPVNGVCNNAQKNGCSKGTANDNAIADTDTHYRWHCEGANGGSTASNCQKAKPLDPVNGACNNSQRNGCSKGTANDGAVADTSTHYKWSCVGENGGSTASNCQIAKPVNGACNNAQKNGCATGTANDNAVADTNTHYRWHCEGLHGGTTAQNCQKTKPINGACNNNQKNGCARGIANDNAVADTNTHYRWHCEGLHGGTTAQNCQIAKPVNGACNNAQKNGCTTGTANDSAVPDTSTHYKWSCTGSNGGTTANNCQKAKPVNGACNNSQRNGCSSGTANDNAVPDTDTHYKWSCVGSNGGTTATNCQTAKPPDPVNGACNNAQRNGCTSGTANDSAVPDTSTHYKWSCVGENGGSTASNCQIAKPVNGTCNNAQKNGCATGTANDSAVPDTSTHYKWSCVGSNGGTTASNCQIVKPVNGVCNNAQRNGCSSGTANDTAIADTSTHHTWHCEGANGGTTVTNCQKAKPLDPVNGACDNSQRNGCTTGTANDNAVADTSIHYKWSCVGENGGSTASNCQIVKPINGSCNNTLINGCSTGTANDSAVPDTDTYHKWSCVGLYGGTTVTNCQIAKIINGVCNNNQKNGCTTGTANDSAVPDTSAHYKWSCVGANGGTTATNCQKAKPINGACNNTLRDGCARGIANDNAIADTTTHYTWHCVGLHGGTTAQNCQIAKPINGVCNNRKRNNCISGTANDSAIADTDTHYKWHCEGLHGGNTATNCQIHVPVNGICNNNVKNGCTKGTFQDHADNATEHLWYCVGLGEGNTDSCSIAKKPECNNNVKNNCIYGVVEDMPDTVSYYLWNCIDTNTEETIPDNCAKPADGQCNNAVQGGCTYGTANEAAIADTVTHYRWHCEALEGATSATNCQRAKPSANGQCNNEVVNGCSAGILRDQTDTATHDKWQCLGINGGTTEDCTKAKIINGVCNNEVVNGCSSGTFQDHADSDTHHLWYCVGIEGGNTDSCQKAKPPANGQCNNEVVNGCSAGILRDQTDTATHDKWQCLGINGGTTEDCTKVKIINGVCNNEVVNGCSSGTFQDHADSDTHHLWYCIGVNGGIADDCSKSK